MICFQNSSVFFYGDGLPRREGVLIHGDVSRGAIAKRKCESENVLCVYVCHAKSGPGQGLNFVIFETTKRVDPLG
jgi:hypothetical protein